MSLTRRHVLRSLGAAAAVAAAERWLGAQPLAPVSGGRFVRTMPLGRLDGRPRPPFHQLLDIGLDARQFTDLSSLDADHLVTPTPQFYIRTAHPPALPPARGWTIALGGRVATPSSLELASIERDARDMGVHLMECAGNADPANFGLLSAAQWNGVPMGTVLDRVAPLAGATRIRVTGVDDEQTPTATSNPGAAWIFTRDELERTGAFLALGMNGGPLTLDHGAPVRLVVPDYYGCSCIKWVSRIDWVADDEPAPLQMMEFSTRTHQKGVFRLARDYEPPVIDLAATPVRVEQWVVNDAGRDRIRYRVVGIRWGGSAKAAPLTIAFRTGERAVPVSENLPSIDPSTWSLWSHEWTPSAPGRYRIALGVSDASIRARRLATGYYAREVDIDRV